MGVGQQLAMATMSLEPHERPADTVDPDSLAREAFARDFDVDLDPEMQQDLWSTFDPANPLEPKTARRYVDSILRPGRSRSASESVREFLGPAVRSGELATWLERDQRR